MDWRLKYFGIFLGLIGCSVHAEPYLASVDGRTVFDKGSGLVWMRCAVGQDWNGKYCSGDASEIYISAADAVVRAKNLEPGGKWTDWRVPNIRELLSLRKCSTGLASGSEDLRDGQPSVSQRCEAGSRQPTNDQLAFPGSDGYYWSSTNHPDERLAWGLHFDYGYLYGGSKSVGRYRLRLVRTAVLSQGDTHTEFPDDLELLRPEFEKRRAEVERKEQAQIEDEERKASIEREAAERKERQEQEKAKRIAEAEERAALKRQLSAGAQGLYLQAGKKLRNGEVWDASLLYELIIKHFPKDPIAIRASDQLTTIRSESSGRTSQGSSGRDSGWQQMCEAQKQTCIASCPRDRDWSFRPDYDCSQRCQSVSCR